MRSVRCLAAAEHPPNKDAGPRKGMEHTGIDMVHKPSADPQGNRYLGHDSQPPRPVSGFLPGQAEAQPPQIGPRKQRPLLPTMREPSPVLASCLPLADEA